MEAPAEEVEGGQLCSGGGALGCTVLCLVPVVHLLTQVLDIGGLQQETCDTGVGLYGAVADDHL